MSIEQVIAVARSEIGKPYVFGTAGPNTFDCSGLVVYAAWHGDNKRLPHFTGSLLLLGTAVSKAELQPGDLVFPDATHVQIYTGGGMVVEAPHTGTNVREVAMWGFMTARRVFSGPVPQNTTTQAVSNPLIPQSVTDFANVVNDPNTWKRIGLYTAGAILAIIGLALLVVDATPGVSSIAGLARKVT